MNAPMIDFADFHAGQYKQTDQSPAFCSGYGQWHSPNNEKDPHPYMTATLAQIEEMAAVPPKVKKERAQWIIFSTLLSRVHSEQREMGFFHALWADVDEPDGLTFEDMKERAKSFLPGLIAYTSKSATVDRQKARIIIPLATPVHGDDFVVLQRILNNKLQAAGITPDRATERTGQVCYLPNRGEFYRYEIDLAAPLDVSTWSDDVAQEQQRQQAEQQAQEERREQARIKAIQRAASGSQSPIDAYNAAANLPLLLESFGYVQKGKRWLSPNSESGVPGVTITDDGKWLSAHGSDAQIGTPTSNGTMGDAFDLFVFYAHGGDLDRAVKAAAEMFSCKAGTNESAREAADPRAESRFYRLTELGNAERFADEHGADVRYVPSLKKWIAYDGRRWKIGADEQIRQLAHKTAKNLYVLAAKEQDNDVAGRIAKWAAQSCKSSSITAMLKEASAILAIDIAKLDADPMLFNCANCTINFHTGGVQQHYKADFITKITEVPFHPDAEAPLFEQVVNTAFKGNVNLIQFVQKYLGYAMTGSIREQCIAILHGTGANGKSTILNAAAEALGEYAQTTRPETLMAKRDSGIPSDVAKLKGARLVLASESEDGHRLAESAIKQMTGGEKIQARALYQDWFEFAPQFKIVLCTNHKPIIRGDDYAIWRRIRLVPFEHVIPENERDLDLADKLRAELPGILKWCVVGAAQWLAEGLGQPEEIVAATEDYKTEQNVLSLFFEHCCTMRTDATCESSQLFLAFDRWRTREGQRRITQRKFGMMLTDAGFEKRKTGGRYSYFGIGLNEGHQEEI